MTHHKIYHFSVPDTKLTYTVKLGYEGDYIRSFEVSNLIFNTRAITEEDLSAEDRDRYLKHLSSKITNISIITR